MKKKQTYSAWSNYRFLYRELWKYDKKIIFFALAQVVFQTASALGTVWIPSVIVGVLERYIGGNGVLPSEMAWQAVLFFCGYGLVCAAAVYLRERNDFQYIQFRMAVVLNRFFKKNMDLDYSQYEDEKIQKMREKANGAFESNNVGIEGIYHMDVEMLTEIAELVLFSGMIAGVSPWMVFLLIGISLLQVAGYRLANRYEVKNKDKEAELSVTRRYLDRQAYDVSVGKDIRIYQLKDWLISYYKRANKQYQNILAKEKTCYFANDLFGLILQFFRDAVCYGYLMTSLKNGMPVAQFVLYIGVIGGFSAYFSALTQKISKVGGFHKAVSFYREYIDLEQAYHHGIGKRLPDMPETIEVVFSHVSFSYPGTDHKILDDLSFTIKKGEKAALVGINGAGKTTIVKLLCGFYQPDSGNIYLNGVDITELDLDCYQKELAVVFQEAFTFSFSIADNVSCCIDQEYDREKCVDVLKRAGLWEKVSRLPKQENTCLNKDVEEDGIQLSGGELQKLMLARALYKDCRLLLLDEPTAALDAIAENEMYEKYSELTVGKTTLFISHRLASTRFCDHILFLENGKLKEEGTHEELMKKNGSYAEMFQVQSKYYKDEPTVCAGGERA